jgi:hypothetical protein
MKTCGDCPLLDECKFVFERERTVEKFSDKTECVPRRKWREAEDAGCAKL